MTNILKRAPMVILKQKHLIKNWTWLVIPEQERETVQTEPSAGRKIHFMWLCIEM